MKSKKKKYTKWLIPGLILIISWLLTASFKQQQLDNKTGYLNKPYLEWELEWEGTEGNPYDVIAKATFTHIESGNEKTSLMYYAGDSKWRFRFTGTKVGTWIVETTGPGNLGGHNTSVDVKAAEKKYNGFLGSEGTRWIWTGSGKEHLPQLVMRKSLHDYWKDGKVDVSYIDKNIQEFIIETGFTGYHLEKIAATWFDIKNPGNNTRTLGEDVNPDPKSFSTLEEIITRVYNSGGFTHLWLWGSDYENWGGKGGPRGIGGPMGEADKRLNRYIAARLGPIPGWTMGYGSDLHKWVNADELQAWYNYLKTHLGGWQHIIGARADADDAKAPVVRKPLSAIYWKGDYEGHYDYRVAYPWYVEVMEAADRPQISEDRFRIRWHAKQFYEKDYSPDMTVRGLWHSTMAGGVANIWGNLLPHNSNGKGSMPYNNKAAMTLRGHDVKVDIKDEIKTYSVFWFDNNRFSGTMIRDNKLTGNRTGDNVLSTKGEPISVCLRDKKYTKYVFYTEDAKEIVMDLSGTGSSLKAVAVDTRKSYKEISLGMIEPEKFTWEAPYKSDWALAVGNFNDLLR